MRFLRLLLTALCLALVGSVTIPAHALGSLSISATPTWDKRSQKDRRLDFINRQDCLDDATLSFVATFTGPPPGAFEVWAGANCDTVAARSTATPTCVLVYTGQNTTQTVTVRVQGMVRPVSDSPTVATAGDKSSCNNSTTTASTRTLFFLVYDTGSNTSTIPTTPKWTYKYDTVGPNPPTGISVGAGEGSLTPRFTAPTGEATLVRYHFYCAEATNPTGNATSSGGTGGTGGTASAETGGTAGTAGTDAASSGTAGTDAASSGGTDTGGTSGTAGTDTGGTSGTAGTDTGGTAGTGGTSISTAAGGDSSSSESTAASDDPTCGSNELVPGDDPPAGLKECGQVTAQGASDGETDNVLENGVRYALAIAAEDDANNIGKLSKLACGVPEEVTGFFEAYRAAGGRAGGGYCTFAPAGRGAIAMGAFLLVAAGMLVVRRRK